MWRFPRQAHLPSPTYHLPGSRRPLLDSLLVILSLENPLHVDPRRGDRVRVEGAELDQLLDLRNRQARRCRHYGVEVPRRLAINQVAPAVALPGFDEGEVGREAALEQILAAVEFAHLFALGHDGPDAGGCIEAGNPRAARPDALGEGPLGHQLQVDPAR